MNKVVSDKNYDIIYVVSKLDNVGPTNQTLNIIKKARSKYKIGLITIFEENQKDSMREKYQQNGIEILACLKCKNFFDAIFFGRLKMKKVFKEINAYIIHSYGIVPDYLCSFFRKKTFHLITLRNFPKEDIFSRMNYFLAIFTYLLHISVLKKCKKVVCCSESIKNKMFDRYKLDNICFIQNGTDVSRFIYEEKKEKHPVIFICASNLISRKRLQETIYAFINSKIGDKGKLLIVGDGIEKEKLINMSKEESNISFLGKKSDIEKYYLQADVFLSSSESEGMPNSLLEALASGLYPIVSDIPQHKEVINTTNCYGELYELGNVQDLSFKIKQAIEYSYNTIRKDNSFFLKNSCLTAENMGNSYLVLYQTIFENL